MIKVQNLVAAYGGNIVLDDISLEVDPLEILVIMGQSGCGKSTFMRHLIGLQKPRSGVVEIDGVNVTQMDDRDYRTFCRSVGVLFQSGGLFNSMTVGENVAFPLNEHTRLADPVIEIVVKLKLQQVGLPGVEDLMPSQLSGGMKKRAGLARALALDPTILFLDEPTTGLDPIIGAGIDDLIVRIRGIYKATMVVVAHDIASSMRIADRIAIFRGNALIELGTPEQIRASANSYVQQFLRREADKPEEGGYTADLLR
ncbi:MAG: ATP-binding cassette domain-containing protein [Candidatus Brocadiae bacterium]|nr:ATP-binding cassette domain-containing protein [Candidatus Brocadiia bacterium]